MRMRVGEFLLCSMNYLYSTTLPKYYGLGKLVGIRVRQFNFLTVQLRFPCWRGDFAYWDIGGLGRLRVTWVGMGLRVVGCVTEWLRVCFWHVSGAFAVTFTLFALLRDAVYCHCVMLH
jgi:hypothetical protein